jgi:hypothetical protein
MRNTINLYHFVDNFIRENKKVTLDGYVVNLDKLPEIYLEEFTAHLIEHDSYHHTGWDWLMDDSFREETAGVFAEYMLSFGEKKKSLQEILLTDMKKMAVSYYRNRIESLIAERINEVEIEDDYEHRYEEDAA